MVRLEEAISAFMMPRPQYVKFNADALIRVDTKTRHEIYQIDRNIGLRNIDELRALEDEEPLPDGQGQSYPPRREAGDHVQGIVTIETRHTAGAVQLRKAEDGTVRMGGYALKFNRLSSLAELGGFVRQVAPAPWSRRCATVATSWHATSTSTSTYSGGPCRRPSASRWMTRVWNTRLTFLTRSTPATWRPSPSGATCSTHRSRSAPSPTSGVHRARLPAADPAGIQLVDVAPVVNPAYLDTTSGLRTLAEARHLDRRPCSPRPARNVSQRSSLPLRAINDKRDSGPGETHPLIALRQRQAAFAQRRTPR